MTAIKEKPICRTCRATIADEEDMVVCNCGRWLCQNCGSLPEGICDKCGKEYEKEQNEFKKIND